MEVSAAAPVLMFTESVTFRNIQAYSFDLLSMLVMSCKESVTESLFFETRDSSLGNKDKYLPVLITRVIPPDTEACNHASSGADLNYWVLIQS